MKFDFKLNFANRGSGTEGGDNAEGVGEGAGTKSTNKARGAHVFSITS